MSNINLSLGVRQNLVALQGTADLLRLTQNRLATGLKVDSALDNPNAFFTASGLTNRATDLQNLQDDSGQAIQTLKSADEGIKAITKLVESAKAIANQAIQTSNQHDRKGYAISFNRILDQTEGLAQDSAYKGKNLLGGVGNDLTVNFNEDNSNKLTIKAVDYTDTTLATGLNLQDLEEGASGTGAITFSAAPTGATTLVTDAQFTAGDVLTFTDGNGTELGTIEITATTTVKNLEDKLSGFGGVSAEISGSTLSITSEADLQINSTNSANFGDASGNLAIDATTDSDFASDSNIRDTIAKLNSALNTLRAQSSVFGTNLQTVQIRQDFTKALINTLREGAGKLTLADSNEEGANLLALQTRQTLANTALSLASQADQSVLRLF